MSDEEKRGSNWTRPPKGKAKKPRTNKATMQRRGREHAVNRRAKSEKIFAELEAELERRQNPPEDPPLMDATDLLPPGEPVEELRGLEKQGRGTTYRSEYARIAQSMCELGATDIQLARALGVSLSTMWGWQARHEEFFRAMIVGKDLPDEKVVRALYQRAVGYTYPEVELKTVRGEVKAFPKLTHIPPDVTACQAWLRARRRSEWNPAANLNLTSDESFQNLWLAVSQGQTMPMIDVTPTEVMEHGE
jgi:hypothetical protein